MTSPATMRLVAAPALLAVVLISTSCLDSACPTIQRTADIPADAVEHVGTVLQAHEGGRVAGYDVQRRGAGSGREWLLRLPSEAQVSEVTVVLTASPPRLLLRSDVLPTADGPEAARAFHDEQVRDVYVQLRAACSALPPWSTTTRVVERPQSGREASRALSKVGLGAGLLLVVVLATVGLVLQRAARLRMHGGGREARVPWPRRDPDRTPKSSAGDAP